MFLAVGNYGQRLVSPNGIDWSNLVLGKDGEVFRAAAFGNGRWVAVGTYGGDNLFASTPDGINWTSQMRDARFSAFVRGLTFGHDAFLAIGGDPGGVGDSKPFVVTSPDGVTWSDITPIAGKNILRRVAFGDGKFVGVGDRGRRAASADGRTWSDAPDVKAIDTLVDIAFGHGVFVGVGLNGLRMITHDGIAWSDRQLGEEGEHLNSVLWAADRFVAIAQGATLFSSDGIKWTRQENHNAPLIAAWGNGVFVGAAWRGRLLHSTDAVHWKEVHKSPYHFEAIVYGG